MLLLRFQGIRSTPHALVRLPAPAAVRPNIARFCAPVAQSAQQPNGGNKMENQQEKNTGDVMYESFGEGYATRSEEEGFGGIYGEKQLPKKDAEENDQHGPGKEYEKAQGSEVKEKEKGRNHEKASN